MIIDFNLTKHVHTQKKNFYYCFLFYFIYFSMYVFYISILEQYSYYFLSTFAPRHDAEHKHVMLSNNVGFLLNIN